MLGVLGHVDHGKSALVRALTGKDTDQLAEEKERGISIALGFAHLGITADTEIDLIDMPGHERFIRTMISGATGIDAVLLVVAANEGIKPQTVEHIDIASLLGLRRALLVITKTDLVTAEQARRVGEEAAALSARVGLEASPPLLTSVKRGEGVEAVREALRKMACQWQPRTRNGMTFLPIDRAFTVPGHGPVVTGTLRGEGIAAGDTLELLPSLRPVRVRGVQVHGALVKSALPGQRVAVNLRSIEIGRVKRGMALATPGSLALSEWLTMGVRSVEAAPPLKNGSCLRALLGTTEFNARLRLLDRDVLEPCQSAFAQLHCAEPVAIPAGEHVILRIASPAQTVGGGKILEVATRRRKRNEAQLLKWLDELHGLSPEAMIVREVERAGVSGTSLQHLSRLSTLSPQRVEALLVSCSAIVSRSGWVVGQADMEKLLVLIPRVLKQHPAGLSVDHLLDALPGVTPAVLDEALQRLQSRGAVRRYGGQFFLPRPVAERARTAREGALKARVARLLQQSGLAPPTPRELFSDPQVKRAVGQLLREGVIVKAVDRDKGREIIFHQDAVETARHKLTRELAVGPGLRVTEIGQLLGISRKYCMPLLNYLDELRFTRRIDDRRVLYRASQYGR